MIMNEYQQKLYKGLINLIATNANGTFQFKEHNKDGVLYHIFNYRLASYSDFCAPYALECRGHMFEVDRDGRPLRLASLPMEKFFNLNENPFTENLDLSNVKKIMNKEDGSLISTYLHNGKLQLKTKASLESEQAIDAMNWLVLENPDLYDELYDITLLGYTVNMEWTSPHNRIVLGYPESSLKILNIRSNYTGQYSDIGNFSNYKTIKEYSVPNVDDIPAEEINLFVQNIPDMPEIEGFVLELKSGQKVKVKTDWYLVRHRAKDSINAPRRLFEAIVTEAIDDVRTLFHGDPVALQVISEMEQKVEPIYNNMIKTVEKFYDENQSLTRKDYAIKAQSLQDGFMSLYMNLYIGRDNDYRQFAIKNYKMFIGDVKDNPLFGTTDDQDLFYGEE